MPKLKFSVKGMSDLKGETLGLGTVSLDFSRAELEEATIKIGEGRKKTYGTDLLWYYLHTMTIPGASKRMFENLFILAKWAEPFPVFLRFD